MQVLNCYQWRTWDGVLVEGNTLWEQYHRHQRLRGCIAVIIETMELDDCGWGLAALEKDKERLRG